MGRRPTGTLSCARSPERRSLPPTSELYAEDLLETVWRGIAP
jgi:hypothetical protein